MANKNHQNFFATNLTSNVSAGATTTPLNDIPTIAAPFYLTFDATGVNGSQEVVLVTSKTATNVNHAALSYDHTTAEEVRQSVVAEDFNTKERSIWIPASGFNSIAGSPSSSYSDDTSNFWLLDDSSTERVGTTVMVPRDYSSGNLTAYVYFTTLTGNAGDVRLSLRSTSFVDEDSDVLTAVSAGLFTETVIATAKDLNISAAINLGSSTVGYMKGISFGRIGGDVADTLTGDICFLGLRIDYTAF